ncbi:hypothetical protein BGX27_005233 [Mortierella sp. AM989]|nr:hypothetical protein BGX27_005233 [Mortierella sp. AM989]
MTAPSGTRVNKVKIPAFPYRPRAEAVLYDCLSEKEREILSIRRENNNNNYNTNTPEFEQARKEGNHLSVRIQQNAETVQPHEAQFKQNAHLSDDKFAEGLDAEWLEYVGSDEIGAEKPNRNNVGAILYLHGGGYYTGSKEEHRVMIGPLVKRLGKHIRVLTVNYRLAPQHPFPAALVDALSSYMWLLDQSISESFSLSDCNPEDKLNDKFQPNQIIFMGDSAGGGLALSLSLLIRDHGSLPQPLSIVTWSPWLDLTQSLPSFNENATTDCIPYEEYIHRHSEAVNKMFEQQEIDGDMDENNDTKPRIRQRAQTCGSAERFTNECILMAARLEEQQQPCRIDIHEDMPHVFPLFRFHPSAIAALDRTCNYIREVIRTSHAEADKDDVLIPISSTSSSSSSSRSSSPLLPSGRFEQTAGSQIFEFGEPLEGSGATRDYAKRPNGFHRTDSLSSISSVASEESVSAISVTSPSLISRVFSKGKQALLPSVYGKLAGKDTPDSPTDASQAVGNPIKRAVKIRTTVNVVDLSGYSVTSYHKRNRYGRCDNTSSQRRRHRRSRLKLRDVVSDATLYEWEILLKQDYIPTRHWPLPPSSRK